MNDVVRYDVYSPELDRREFRYLFPAVFLYVLLYIAYVGAYVFGVERTVIAFIGGIAPGKSSVSCPLKPSDSAPLKHSTMPP